MKDDDSIPSVMARNVRREGGGLVCDIDPADIPADARYFRVEWPPGTFPPEPENPFTFSFSANWPG